MELFRQVLAWLHRGEGVVLFTVIKTWGSSPRPPGSMAAIGASGGIGGSVSGGCVEDDLRTRALAGEFTHVQTVTYGITKEQQERFALPCGGTLELLAEPVTDATIEPVLAALQRHTPITRCVDVHTGGVTWEHSAKAEDFSYDGQTLRRSFGPAWRLLIIGAGEISRYAAQFALALDYRVRVCEPREAYRLSWSLPAVELLTLMPDDAVRAHAGDPCSAVVALTHDPKLDDMALMEALLSPAFYVGSLGSRKTSAARRERLRSMDIPEDALARLHAPVGLPIGSRTPAEIALSVLAEMTAARHGIPGTG